MSSYFMDRWCHDIGREQAANKPLLKTVFQVVCSHEVTSVRYSKFEFLHSDLSFIFRSWCVYLVLGRQHCFLLYVIKQRFTLYPFLWMHPSVLCLYSMNGLSCLLLSTDSAGKSGAYSKRRYSKGFFFHLIS